MICSKNENMIQKITVYGKDINNKRIQETVKLQGCEPVTLKRLFKSYKKFVCK